MITPAARQRLRDLANGSAPVRLLPDTVLQILDTIDALETEVSRIAALKLTPGQTLTPDELAVLVDFHRRIQAERT